MLSNQDTDMRVFHHICEDHSFIVMNSMAKNPITPRSKLIELIPIQGEFRLGIIGTTIGFKFSFDRNDDLSDKFWDDEFPRQLQEACDLLSLVPIHSD
jgi:hypothetical protein